ncbi:hypothetical protein L195_g028932 [Trifolium pratense]|uniref:UPF0261 domain-containing protein n=1 Tax=Trifolium pratense TaxID=57577 RepID=A0A2K3L3D6_TRIPR|nr:hypothetical protein L195_g028932 [Trifolium pratense]
MVTNRLNNSCTNLVLMGVSPGSGVIGVSGSGGTSLLSSPFMSLSIGIPKLIVSTVASGQIVPYIGTSDLVLFPSIVDVDSVNSVSRVVFSNVAAAFAGMVIGRIQSLSNSFKVVDKPTVGITMFGLLLLVLM